MPQINDIRELAQQNARYVSNSPQDWMGYLDVAARLYRYSFTDALLIHAQRPDATACAELELWNQKMSRWVNRGSKGIALLDDTGPRTRLRYVFDIADTHLVRGGRTPLLWNLDSHEHEQAILDHLADTYGLSQTDSMNTALMELAQQLTADNLDEAMDGLAHEVADTFLEELDEDNIRVRFRELMTNSKTESDSIANQRTLLEAYAADHPELCIVDEFVDDGYSGSNFERPAFQRLFQELEQGTINCVLVKDLSRFGRNYIEVGRYLERIFPVMRVRLIAVTDNYDSQSAWKNSDSIMVPMRNLLNDAYCRDISVKIKSQLAVKRKRGDFVGSFATYGYQKDPDNHTKLIVDELAAETVQNIFCWKIGGMSNQGIANRLNAEKVPSPAARKLQSGAKLSLHFRKSDEPPWSAKAVDRILHNEVYTGKLVQGKTRRLDYRSKKKMNSNRENGTY